jgi:serine/threonine protein kinase
MTSDSGHAFHWKKESVSAMQKKIKDEYEIIAELGVGGMATVYKAVQRSLNRPVAIKELKKAYRVDDKIAQRFEREARLAASFQHENIIHIYDYLAQPVHAIVMEYVDGTTLARIIEETGALPTDVGVMIAIQVANALEYAHARGLIHRDIKPGNIMVKRNGEVKLMDFGIARMREMESLTLPGTLMGTPSYMSPEQVLGQPLDARSDIFSFGIVMYEMFTGIKPFPDEEDGSSSSKILKGKYLSPRSIYSDIPRSLQRIIKKCLKIKPHKRYGSMQELGRVLGKRIKGMDKPASLKRISDYLVDVRVFEAPPEDEKVAISQAPRMGIFTKVLVVAAGVLIVLFASIGYYSWKKAIQARTPPAVPSLTQPGVIKPGSGPASQPTQTAQPGAPPATVSVPANK